MFNGLLESAIKFFGITTNPYEGGYMVKSGEILDFSGRHLKVGFRNHTILNDKNIISIEHGIFYGINHSGYCLTKEFPNLMLEKNCVASFMFYTGCIRYKITPSYNKETYIDFVRTPTEKQIDELSKIFLDRPVSITQTSLNGDVLMDERITCFTKEKFNNIIRNRKNSLIVPQSLFNF